MANGAPSINGQQSGHVLRSAAERDQEQRELLLLLQQTMNNPAVSHSARVCLVAIGWAGAEGQERPLVLIALPNGERYEFPISDGERRTIVTELADRETTD